MKNRKGITIYLESEEDKENYFTQLSHIDSNKFKN